MNNVLYKNYKFEHLVIILSILCVIPYFIQAQQITKTIKQDRQNNHAVFLKKSHNIQNCGKILDNLSLQIKEIIDTASKRTNVCKSPVTERERYYNCVNLTKQIINRTKTIQNKVLETQNTCGFFTEFQYFANSIQFSLNIIERSLRNIGDEGLGFWVNSFKKSEETLYKERSPFRCNMDMLNVTANKMQSPLLTTPLAYLAGDIFNLNKSLSELRITKDYVFTIAKVCKAKAFNRSEDDNNKNKLIEEKIAFIDKKVKEVEQVTDDLLNEYGNSSFEELSKKACTHLKEKNRNTYGLCEAPVNTPEWTYSLHNIITKVDKE